MSGLIAAILARWKFSNGAGHMANAGPIPGVQSNRQRDGIGSDAPQHCTWTSGNRPYRIVVTAMRESAGTSDSADGVLLAFDAISAAQGEAWATEVDSAFATAPYVIIPLGVPTVFYFPRTTGYDGLQRLTARGRVDNVATTPLMISVEASV